MGTWWLPRSSQHWLVWGPSEEEKALTRGSRHTLYADADTWVYRMDGCGDAAPIWVAINRSDWGKSVTLPSGAYVDLMTQQSVGGGQIDLAPRLLYSDKVKLALVSWGRSKRRSNR